jgi:hypothetical protein
MLNKNAHPAEEEMLRYADGELPNRQAAQIRAHLIACWECRARMAEIEGTIAEFVRALHQTIDSTLPPVAGQRALLRAQLAELTAKRPVRSEGWIDQIFSARFTALFLFAVVLTFVVAGSHFFRHYALRAPREMTGSIESGSIPDPTLTPGASRAVQISEVCSMAHEEVIADVSPSLKTQVLREYGIANALPREYEIDYLIAPGLGGTEDIRNLWPEPYNTRPWNAHVKDSLEERLHHLVCAGELDLATAQRDIATDWIAAYKKYFHTDRPLEVSEL